jgi:hypothetical protein
VSATFKIYDDGALNAATLGAGNAYVLVTFGPEGMGYRYSISDSGVLVAYGWVRSKDERTLRDQLHHLVLQLGLECGRGEELQ